VGGSSVFYVSAENFFDTFYFRVYLNAEPGLLSHFASLATKKELPALDPLLHAANILVGRYAPQNAYEQALSTAESTSALAPLKVKSGPPFTSENSHSTNANTSSLLDTGTSNENLEADPSADPTENVSIKRPKFLMETGFSPIVFFSCKI
jgi:hypothetical protein